MYETKKEKRIQTVDEMLRQRQKTKPKVNRNPKILPGTVEAINKFVADRLAFTTWIPIICKIKIYAPWTRLNSEKSQNFKFQAYIVVFEGKSQKW